MGLASRFDPAADPSIAWVIADVVACEPEAATWSKPARVTLAIVEVLRAAGPKPMPGPGAPARAPMPLPQRLTLAFGAPRDAGEQRFYVTRFDAPDAARRLAELDATSVSVPAVGRRVITWLDEHAEGAWSVPTAGGARWIELDDAALAEVRARLGLTRPSALRRWLAKLGLAR